MPRARRPWVGWTASLALHGATLAACAGWLVVHIPDDGGGEPWMVAPGSAASPAAAVEAPRAPLDEPLEVPEDRTPEPAPDIATLDLASAQDPAEDEPASPPVGHEPVLALLLPGSRPRARPAAPAPDADAAAAGAPPPPSMPAADASAGATAAGALYRPKPPFPARAARLGHEGTVVVALVVGDDGAVVEVEVIASSGFAELDDAAIRTLRRWRFAPTVGEVRRLTQAIRFELRSLGAG